VPIRSNVPPHIAPRLAAGLLGLPMKRKPEKRMAAKRKPATRGSTKGLAV
jgi:hypothetical protein